MKKLMMMGAATMMSWLAIAETEVVNGIKWKYYVEDGKAVVGVKITGTTRTTTTAIPESTKGQVTVPSSLGGYPVTKIENGAFFQCRKITSVIVPEGVTEMESQVFYRCDALTTVSFPDSLEEIDFELFCDCPQLVSISIPAGVETIEGALAYSCPKLSKISVSPDNAYFTTVDGVLYDIGVKRLICAPDAMTSVRVPASVETLDYACLSRESSLEKIVVDDANPAYSSKNGLLYDKSGQKLIACPGGLTRLIIPEGVTATENGATCGNLTYASLPASMLDISEWAFCGVKLRQIDVADANPNYSSSGDMLFDKNRTKLIWSSPLSESLTIPASVKTICDTAFDWNTNYKLHVLTFQGPPPELSFYSYDWYGGLFAYLAYYSGSLKGYYTAYESEWKAVLTNGKWNGLPMSYKKGGDSGSGESEDESEDNDEQGFETSHTFNGLVKDADGVMCGIVQVATGKKSAKGVKVSGFVMLQDGKKQTLKAATAAIENGQLDVATKAGKTELTLTITESGFTGTHGEMTVASGDVGEETGIISGTLKMSYFDAKTGKVKTKSIKLAGVASDGEAVGCLTVKGQAAQSFEAKIVEE